jgi:hypothetical protein
MQGGRDRGLLVLTVSAILFSTCSGSVRSVARTPASWTRSVFHGDSLVVSFAHPASWRTRLQPLSLHYGAIFGFLSNFGVRQFCHSGPTGGGCIWADLGPFPRRGILVTFGTGGYGPGPLSQKELLGTGTSLIVGGHPAHRHLGRGQGCLGTGARSSVSYTVLDGKHQGVFGIEFCYRGPSTGFFVSEAERVAWSLHLGPGPPGLGPSPS